MATDQSILVLGAGELGMAMLRALAQHPQRGLNKLAVLLRSPALRSNDPKRQAQLSELKHLNVATIPGNVTSSSIAELAQLFKPFTTVIGCVGMTGDPGLQIKLAHAVLEACVQRYIPWQFGVDYEIIGRGSAQDLFAEQLDVRDLLRSQARTEWVIVSTGLFTSFLFESFFGVVNSEKTTVRCLGGWQNSLTVTAVEDIGRATAEIVFAAPDIKDQVVFVAGDTVSYAQLAVVLEQCLKRPIKRVEWNLDAMKEELKKNPNDGMLKYKIVFAEARGVAWKKEDTFNYKQGIKMTDLKEWVERNIIQ